MLSLCTCIHVLQQITVTGFLKLKLAEKCINIVIIIDNKELTRIQEYLVISKLKWWSGVKTKKKVQGILSEQLTEA